MKSDPVITRSQTHSLSLERLHLRSLRVDLKRLPRARRDCEEKKKKSLISRIIPPITSRLCLDVAPEQSVFLLAQRFSRENAPKGKGKYDTCTTKCYSKKQRINSWVTSGLFNLKCRVFWFEVMSVMVLGFSPRVVLDFHLLSLSFSCSPVCC